MKHKNGEIKPLSLDCYSLPECVREQREDDNQVLGCIFIGELIKMTGGNKKRQR